MEAYVPSILSFKKIILCKCGSDVSLQQLKFYIGYEFYFFVKNYLWSEFYWFLWDPGSPRPVRLDLSPHTPCRSSDQTLAPPLYSSPRALDPTYGRRDGEQFAAAPGKTEGCEENWFSGLTCL